MYNNKVLKWLAFLCLDSIVLEGQRMETLVDFRNVWHHWLVYSMFQKGGQLTMTRDSKNCSFFFYKNLFL